MSTNRLITAVEAVFYEFEERLSIKLRTKGQSQSSQQSVANVSSRLTCIATTSLSLDSLIRDLRFYWDKKHHLFSWCD